MIKLIVFDIDGVVTDGSVIVDVQGNEQKKINLKDIDAIFELKRRGFILAAITGEKTAIVEYFKNRFPWDYFYSGCKNKKSTIQEIEKLSGIQADEISYVGDGKYDVEPLAYVALGICPADAIDMAKDKADIILQSGGGQGCIWELLSILEQYNNPDHPKNYFYNRLFEHTKLIKFMASDEKLSSTVMEVAELMKELIDKGGQILFFGNGGSAADAQHIATEFISRFYKDRPAMNAEALNVNTSTLTAIGNDYSYERIFVRQIEAKAKNGDMLVGISTSGRSQNVLEALRFGKKNGLATVMLTGDSDNDELNQICDFVIRVPSGITPRVQEAHILIGHVMAEYVEYKKFS